MNELQQLVSKIKTWFSEIELPESLPDFFSIELLIILISILVVRFVFTGIFRWLVVIAIVTVGVFLVMDWPFPMLSKYFGT